MGYLPVQSSAAYAQRHLEISEKENVNWKRQYTELEQRHSSYNGDSLSENYTPHLFVSFPLLSSVGDTLANL